MKKLFMIAGIVTLAACEQQATTEQDATLADTAAAPSVPLCALPGPSDPGPRAEVRVWNSGPEGGILTVYHHANTCTYTRVKSDGTEETGTWRRVNPHPIPGKPAKWDGTVCFLADGSETEVCYDATETNDEDEFSIQKKGSSPLLPPYDSKRIWPEVPPVSDHGPLHVSGDRKWP